VSSTSSTSILDDRFEIDLDETQPSSELIKPCVSPRRLMPKISEVNKRGFRKKKLTKQYHEMKQEFISEM
jgi:hypothetical protein